VFFESIPVPFDRGSPPFFTLAAVTQTRSIVFGQPIYNDPGVSNKEKATVSNLPLGKYGPGVSRTKVPSRLKEKKWQNL
jgi:hypothetical protein